jgi:hypothetical protein
MFLELKRWFTNHKLPLEVLERLIVDPGVVDVEDLSVCSESELQQAGLTRAQMRRFTMLQHQMNCPEDQFNIPQTTKRLDEIKREFTAGRLDKQTSEFMCKGLVDGLARASHVDSRSLFDLFANFFEPVQPCNDASAAKVLKQEALDILQLQPPGIWQIHATNSDKPSEVVVIRSNAEGKADMSSLSSGKWGIQIMCDTVPPLPCKSTAIAITRPATSSPVPIQVKAVLTNTSFPCEEKHIADQDVTGKFIDAHGTLVAISGKTDASGKFERPFPPGQLDIHTCRDGKVIGPKQPIQVPDVEPSPDGSQPVIDTILIDQQSNFQLDVLKHVRGGSIAILGDVSGSMSGPHNSPNIDLLKKTLNSAIEDVLENGPSKKLYLAAWSHRQFWYSKKSCVTKETRADAHKWVDALRAQGENDMKSIIDQAVMIPEISDIVVMCDGDISPFSVSSFQQYAAKYKTTMRFHFVTIGQHASTADMAAMAQDGNGFWMQVL